VASAWNSALTAAGEPDRSEAGRRTGERPSSALIPAAFVIGLGLIALFYSSHAPDDLSDSRLNPATCEESELADDEAGAPASFAPWIVCKEPKTIEDELVTDRRRLDFLTFRSEYPELGTQIALIRDRVRDLAVQSEQLERRALRRHVLFSSLFLVAGLLSITATLSPPRAEISTASKASWWRRWVAPWRNRATIVAILAVLAALQQSVAYHTQHAALLESRHRLEALGTRIDHEAVTFALALRTGVETARLLPAATTKPWIDELATIQRDFAQQFGTSYNLFQLSGT